MSGLSRSQGLDGVRDSGGESEKRSHTSFTAYIRSRQVCQVEKLTGASFRGGTQGPWSPGAPVLHPAHRFLRNLGRLSCLHQNAFVRGRLRAVPSQPPAPRRPSLRPAPGPPAGQSSKRLAPAGASDRNVHTPSFQVLGTPNNQFWINVFADSSSTPGMDAFGIICEIFVHNSLLRVFTLPGLMLGHGRTSALDKLMALLWSLYLVTGPSVDSFVAAVFNIRSMCTDQGVR